MTSYKYGSLLGAVPLTRIDNMEDGDKEPVVQLQQQQQQQQPPSITFADLGIPTSANLQDTLLGKARPVSDITWKERIYAALMLLSIIAAAVMTIIRLTTVSTNEADFTFCLVLLLNAAFCIWFVIEGVLRERPSELFILTSATVLIMVYLIVNYVTGYQNDIKLGRLVIACIFCPVVVILGLIIAWQYHASKRLIFRTVGANEMLQTLYRNLLVFQDFLKFDLQLGGSMIILILTIPEKIKTGDIVILSVGGAITVAWFILGFFTMPKEWKIGAYIFFLFSPAELAYVFYKIYDAVHCMDTYQRTDSDGVIDAMIACGVGAIVVRLTVIIVGAIVFRHFGLGLKEKLKTPSSTS